MSEPTGREGVALLLARALSEGTQRLDAYGFAVAGERLGATWRADTDWDSLRCGFEVPADQLLAATELLAEAVRQPAFDESTLERVRDERLDELSLDLSQPGPRAAAAFASAIFTPGTRYSTPDGGDVETVSSLGTATIREFHASRFSPATATLILVGDLSGADVATIGAAMFEGWEGTATSAARP